MHRASMATNSARIPLLVSEDEKARIAAAAAAAGVSVGEYLRRAVAAYRPDDEDEAALAAMIGQLDLATERAERAIDDALAFVEASNARIERMEREAAKRKVA